MVFSMKTSVVSGIAALLLATTVSAAEPAAATGEPAASVSLFNGKGVAPAKCLLCSAGYG